MSGKGMILRWLGAVALREATVTTCASPAPRYLRVRLRGAVPRGEPGDKVQVLLPGDDVRTYTPFAWSDEGEARGFSLLVFLHGDTPAARWARSLREGDVVRFVGPQRALRMPDGPLLRRVLGMLYVQALLLGHHPLTARELELLNGGLLDLIGVALGDPDASRPAPHLN